MKLTHTQKLHALAYRFYQGAAWTPKAGDFYTTSRADLELYQVISVEGGIVRTRYTEGSDAISEWPEAGFLTEGFGPKRVFVPEWVLNLKSPPEASNMAKVVDNSHEGTDQLNPVFVAHKSSLSERDHVATDSEQWLSSKLDTEFLQRLSEYKPDGHDWFHVTSVDEMQAFYLSRLPAIREAARELGYAIGLHGSTRRDLDLIAMPWREGASDRDTLAHAIAKAACGLGRDGAYDWTVKPAGRFATSIPICWNDFEPRVDGQGMIDLSVIIAPPTPKPRMFSVSMAAAVQEVFHAAAREEVETIAAALTKAIGTEPYCWEAVTDYVGTGQNCSKFFFIPQLAAEHIRKHGGYVKPLYASPTPPADTKAENEKLEARIAALEAIYQRWVEGYAFNEDDPDDLHLDARVVLEGGNA